MDSHILNIQNILGIDLALAEEIRTICKPIQFPANTIIQKRGTPDSKALFLLKGICKYSIFDKKGIEFVSQIDSAECFLAYGFFGFYRKKHAVVNFISITDIEGLEIDSEKLMPIVDKNPQLYLFFIDLQLKRHQLIQSKEISIIQKTNTERYLEFVDLYRDVIHDIPLKDIASYLSIHPGSLSRIRKNINS